MNHLIVGFGEIGQAVSVILEDQSGVTIAIIDPEVMNDVPESVDVLHVCFPYDEHFIREVYKYRGLYHPEHIIIYSTVPIGTTGAISKAVHSPVEGRHPHLDESIRRMPRWIGYNDIDEGKFFHGFFRSLGLETKAVADSHFTEFLKLRSTAKYGINIAWAEYEKHVADEIGMSFELLKEFDRDYNELYKSFGMDWAQRYILDAPEGPIGGHCVVPNAEILDQQFPSDMLKIIKEVGHHGKESI